MIYSIGNAKHSKVISSDPVRPVLTCAQLADREGAGLELHSTDSYRLLMSPVVALEGSESVGDPLPADVRLTAAMLKAIEKSAARHFYLSEGNVVPCTSVGARVEDAAFPLVNPDQAGMFPKCSALMPDYGDDSITIGLDAAFLHSLAQGLGEPGGRKPSHVTLQILPADGTTRRPMIVKAQDGEGSGLLMPLRIP